MIHRTTFRGAACLLMMTAWTGLAQEAASPKPEELEQLLAPVALHPDSLIAQILMASTYPLEVVQAERFARQNEDLRGDELTAALEQQSWDPSVKSLVNFPQVLSMMSEKLDWTTQLGDAFLSNQKEVMETVQKLRERAKSEGNLETTEQQTVIVMEEADTQVIVIKPAEPEVIYVPTYNPTVVYGTWPYPAYPPYYYYPPGYPATAAISFGAGFACGAAWGYAWGGCNWGHGDVDIDIDRNAFVNNKIDRSRYKSEIGSRNRSLQNGRGSWQHDAAHRKGAAYRDPNTARRFGGTTSAAAARARDSFRGRAESGRQDLARSGADRFPRGASPTSAGQRDRAGVVNRQQPSGRSQPASRQQVSDRAGSAAKGRGADRGVQGQGGHGGAFDGVNRGSSARNNSQRGQASRSSFSASGGRSSMSRGGGGRGGRR